MKKYICQFKDDPNSSGQKKIMAVKLLRESAGCGLKQAKNIIDGKLALMTEVQVLDFIRSSCETTHPDDILVDAIYGVEWKVVGGRTIGGPPWSTPRRWHADLTGYLFVVHREHEDVEYLLHKLIAAFKVPKSFIRDELPF